ncbi:hypothetical protein J2X70_002041 [Stenotrophomonas sp. 1337]|nr:hypothetical protein [Stenotrophomonas sp. 1337]
MPASGRHYRARLPEGLALLQQHSCYKDVLAATPQSDTAPTTHG